MSAIEELRRWLSVQVEGDRSVVLSEWEADRCRELLEEIAGELA